jgi:hypothetical protein
MEYSPQLTSAAKIFAQNKYHFEIFADSSSNLKTIVAILKDSNGHSYKGSATGEKQSLTLIRAVVEAGESRIASGKYNNRAGIAGGFFKRSTINRAIGELIEKDAFLFHFRQQIPGKLIERNDVLQLVSIQLSAARSDYNVVLSTTTDCAFGNPSCIILGLGVSRTSLIEARKKSEQEVWSMLRDHEIRKNWCSSVPGDSSNYSDLHHIKSRDHRTIKRFQSLFHDFQNFPDREENFEVKIERLESPLRFIRYYKAYSNSLLKIEFGQPEPYSSSNDPLYHPIW